jgi:hypothetical protein
MEDNGLEPMTFWLPGTLVLIRRQGAEWLKIWEKPCKRRRFPTQTTPSFYSIFLQSQQGKTLFLGKNPYAPPLFSRKPLQTLYGF